MSFSREAAPELPDAEILVLSRSSPEHFAILVARYEAPLLRRAKAILRSDEDAEEAVQDAFTRIYLYADRYEAQEGASFSSWAYAILNRVAYTKYQKLKAERGVRTELEPESFERIADREDFVADLTARDEVLQALAKLPESAARLLRLQFLEGKNQEEMARIEGASVSAVKTRVHRAKKLFRETFNKQR
ncbi:MAG: sigma-70 family RNA polymerase sigma factor [bacterium]